MNKNIVLLPFVDNNYHSCLRGDFELNTIALVGNPNSGKTRCLTL